MPPTHMVRPPSFAPAAVAARQSNSIAFQPFESGIQAVDV